MLGSLFLPVGQIIILATLGHLPCYLHLTDKQSMVQQDKGPVQGKHQSLSRPVLLMTLFYCLQALRCSNFLPNEPRMSRESLLRSGRYDGKQLPEEQTLQQQPHQGKDTFRICFSTRKGHFLALFLPLLLPTSLPILRQCWDGKRKQCRMEALFPL